MFDLALLEMVLQYLSLVDILRQAYNVGHSCHWLLAKALTGRSQNHRQPKINTKPEIIFKLQFT